MRAALSLVLLTAGSCLCAAGPYSDLKLKLGHAKSDDQVIRTLQDSGAIAKQGEIADTLDNTDLTSAQQASQLRAEVDLRAMAETPVPGADNVKQEAQAIKQSPLYHDPGIDRRRNWLADALDRIKKIRLPDRESNPHMSLGGFGLLGALVYYAAWGLLIAGVLALLFLAIRHVKWRNTLTRKAQGLMDQDEPDRTLDEWLQLADAHAAAGRFREAVRALYLACLLRFDENDVARFDRGETNWEHLTRIEASPQLPEGIDFRTTTQKFDRIWYGYQTQGMPDVNHFRAAYQLITEALKAVPA